MSALKLLVGCDPELFLKDNAGQFVSAHGLIPGTKNEPFKVRNGAVQVDGNALEFNITPAETQAAFIGNVRDVMEQMRQMVPGYNYAIEPVAVFDQAIWDKIPDTAKELGCEPDFNAYTREINEPPELNGMPMSAAGGHIHIGWGEGIDPMDPSHFSDCCEVVKQLDYYLGLYSLMWDPDNKRRLLYGKAGCFRPKPYGVEYRSLSNAWLAHGDNLIAWVYDATIKAVRDLHKGHRADRYNHGIAAKVINASDRGWWHTWSAAMYTNNQLPPPVVIEPEAKPKPRKRARIED